ncbi:heterokaryon incompatibility protein-domain-containing protein [Podospora aff. communis PSN243]|uniref:Heterokaryon incompatibility protein-domain-containing protein n=1 Tax=Podospora aff. communis PSN243 TaxID=3040156 RepID=A0AAV9GBP8_9PEZI|nr:heterokaryon incompatibility protein-domain-containing protein [Podospora aff. communis PSN243]
METITKFTYTPLPGGSIRLLRLLPSHDSDSPIHCELIDYTLLSSPKQTHLFEAMSYAWGSADNPKSIHVNGRNLAVTCNLYAALARLRDHVLDRVLWVDAICINQEDVAERGRQGEDSTHALDVVNACSFGDALWRPDDKTQKALVALLGRPWFRRTWVLQEVAAARHIYIICGDVDIDGHAFALGLKALRNFWAANALKSSHPTTHLMEHAPPLFRGVAKDPTSFSLRVHPLGDLIDLYHHREATYRRDKIYALLGMSSDMPSSRGLVPDYTVSWKSVLRQVVITLFGNKVGVLTWEGEEVAIIQGRCRLLGKVTAVKNDDLSASVGKDDIQCLLDGASKPTILRLCGDYFFVIATAITVPNESLSDLSNEIEEVLHDVTVFNIFGDPEFKHLISNPEGVGESGTAIAEAYKKYYLEDHPPAELCDHAYMGIGL